MSSSPPQLHLQLTPTAGEVSHRGHALRLGLPLSGVTGEECHPQQGHGPDPCTLRRILYSFNTFTKQVDTQCSCCHPLGSQEKQLVLPCPDPGAPDQQLVLTLHVFNRCACRPWRCSD